jgi:hypothetical protein
MNNDKSESDHLSTTSINSSRSGRSLRSSMKTPVISLEVPSPFDKHMLPPLVNTSLQKNNNNNNFPLGFVSLLDKPKESFNLTKALKNFEKDYQASAMEEMKEYFLNNKKGGIIDDNIDSSPQHSRLTTRSMPTSPDTTTGDMTDVDYKKQDDLDSLDLSTHSPEHSIITSYISVDSNENLNELIESKEKEEQQQQQRLEQSENSTVFKDMV